MVLKNSSGNLSAKEEIALVCEEFGLSRLAIKTFREIIKEAPERSHLNVKLGNCLYMENELFEASRVLEKAIEMERENIEIMVTLANIYFAMKMAVRADKWASRALRLDPDNKEAREILAKC